MENANNNYQVIIPGRAAAKGLSLALAQAVHFEAVHSFELPGAYIADESGLAIESEDETNDYESGWDYAIQA